MNDRENDRLAHHVRVDLSEDRVDRLWGGVSARLGGAAARAGLGVGERGGVRAAAAAAIVVVRARAIDQRPARSVAAATSAWEGAQLRDRGRRAVGDAGRRIEPEGGAALARRDAASGRRRR